MPKKIFSSRASLPRFSPLAILLHWLMAPLLIALLAIGWTMTSLDRGDPLLPELVHLHKSLGLLALLLVAIRLIVRLAKGVPGWPPGMTRNGQRLATGTHHLLYTLMFAIPLCGLLMNVYSGHPVPFFGWTFASPVAADHALAYRFGHWHSDLVWVLAVAIGLHFLGALNHRFRTRNGIFERMLPGRR